MLNDEMLNDAMKQTPEYGYLARQEQYTVWVLFNLRTIENPPSYDEVAEKLKEILERKLAMVDDLVCREKNCTDG